MFGSLLTEGFNPLIEGFQSNENNDDCVSKVCSGRGEQCKDAVKAILGVYQKWDVEEEEEEENNNSENKEEEDDEDEDEEEVGEEFGKSHNKNEEDKDEEDEEDEDEEDEDEDEEEEEEEKEHEEEDKSTEEYSDDEEQRNHKVEEAEDDEDEDEDDTEAFTNVIEGFANNHLGGKKNVSCLLKYILYIALFVFLTNSGLKKLVMKLFKLGNNSADLYYLMAGIVYVFCIAILKKILDN